MIVQAQSGTGKTATFAISILQRLDLDIKDCQVLVLTPARELACGVRLFQENEFLILLSISRRRSKK